MKRLFILLPLLLILFACGNSLGQEGETSGNSSETRIVPGAEKTGSDDSNSTSNSAENNSGDNIDNLFKQVLGSYNITIKYEGSAYWADTNKLIQYH